VILDFLFGYPKQKKYDNILTKWAEKGIEMMNYPGKSPSFTILKQSVKK